MAERNTSVWFRHDANAASNLKHIALRCKYGMAGYGRYWMLVERLTQEPQNRLKLLPEFKGAAIAKVLDMEYVDFTEFIDYCCSALALFRVDDEGSLFCVGLDERLKGFHDVKDSAVNSARNAANARWEKNRAKQPVVEVPKVPPTPKPHNGDQINQLADFWASAQQSGRVSSYDRSNRIRMMYQGHGFDKVMAAMTACADAGKPYIDRLDRILAGEAPETVFGAGPRRNPSDVPKPDETKIFKRMPKPEDVAELKKHIRQITELRDAGAEIPYQVQSSYASLRYSTDSKAEPWYDKYVSDYRKAHPVVTAPKNVGEGSA